MFGGETVRADGKPREIDPEKSFAKAHYEQHVAAKGHFTVGEETYPVDGFGLRDKSWGPRYWSAINWYRWCPMNFGRDFGMMLSIVAGEDGKPREGGMVLSDGGYDLITECKMDTDWDENGYQTALARQGEDPRRPRLRGEGKVLSLIPLRNRRQTPGRQGAQHPHHRGHDRVPLRRPGGLRAFRIPRPDRRRPAERQAGLTAWPKPIAPGSAGPAASSTTRPRVCRRKASRPARAGRISPTAGAARTAACRRRSSTWRRSLRRRSPELERRTLPADRGWSSAGSRGRAGRGAHRSAAAGAAANSPRPRQGRRRRA